MDHVTYLLIIFSGSFGLYTYACLLLALYENSGKNAPVSDESSTILQKLWGTSATKSTKPEGGYQRMQMDSLGNGHLTQDVEADPDLTDDYWREDAGDSRKDSRTQADVRGTL